MAKRKKGRNKQKRSSKKPARKIDRAFEQALELIESGAQEDLLEAKKLLIQLLEKRPGQPAILGSLTDVSLELDHYREFAYYGDQYLPFASEDERGVLINNLVYAYSPQQLFYPALALDHARRLKQEYPDFNPKIDQFIDMLEGFLKDEAQRLEEYSMLPENKRAEAIILQDKVRFMVESSYFNEAIRLGEEALSQGFTQRSMRNNLTLAYFSSGRFKRAEAIALELLDAYPDNPHTLANLVKMTFMTGRLKEAERYVERIKHVQSPHNDLFAKQMESLAYMADDEGIKTIFEQAESAKAMISPFMYHCAAVAHYHSGEQKAAWRLWRKALKADPTFDMAEKSLDERFKSEEERHVPWYYSLHYWFPQIILDELLITFKKAAEGSEHNAERIIKKFLQKYSYIQQLIPVLLERSDEIGRNLMWSLIQLGRSPELLQIALDFAKSPYGPAKMRVEILYYLDQHHPDILPSDRKITVWKNGEQTELLLTGFEITDETMHLPGFSEEVADKFEDATLKLYDDDFEAAEALLLNLREEEPNY
ncbi:MAG: hypothetical protein AAF633_02065, partial [Chloroflexota bacterium]